MNKIVRLKFVGFVLAWFLALLLSSCGGGGSSSSNTGGQGGSTNVSLGTLPNGSTVYSSSGVTAISNFPTLMLSILSYYKKAVNILTAFL